MILVLLILAGAFIPTQAFWNAPAVSTCNSAFMGRQFGELLVQPAAGTHSATVIMLHGLGDTGSGWKPVASQLQLGSHIKWMFPSAPTRPITMNGGGSMPGWFDLGTPTQDDVGIQESIDYISELIDSEVKAGISADRVLVAGFSQGGHLALKTVLKYHLKLAGCIAMSTWLEALSFEVPAAADLPFLICHGDQDVMVPVKSAYHTDKLLKSRGLNSTLNIYPGVAHSSNSQELRDVSVFIGALLPAVSEPSLTRDDVDKMSVKALKQFLIKKGVDVTTLLEKTELIEKAKSLCSE